MYLYNHLIYKQFCLAWLSEQWVLPNIKTEQVQSQTPPAGTEAQFPPCA